MRKVREYFHMIIAAIIYITVHMISTMGQAVSDSVVMAGNLQSDSYKKTAFSCQGEDKAVIESVKYKRNLRQYSPKVVKYICGPGDLVEKPPLGGKFYLKETLITHISLSVPTLMAGPHTPAPEVTMLCI